MLKHFISATLCGGLLAACAPGPEPTSPAVAGTVMDARTRLAVSDARVSVLYPSKDPSATVLSSGTSDAAGHFTLAAHYKFGLVLFYGDPIAVPIIIRISKPKYQTLVTEENFFAHIAPQREIHLDVALIPNSKAQ